jgi:hypothetical protein
MRLTLLRFGLVLLFLACVCRTQSPTTTQGTLHALDSDDQFGFEKGVVLGAISHIDGWAHVKDPKREVRVVLIRNASHEDIDQKRVVFKVECVMPLRCQPVSLKMFHRDQDGGSQSFYRGLVAQLMEEHGISPARLAEGSAGVKDFVISEWIENRDESAIRLEPLQTLWHPIQLKVGGTLWHPIYMTVMDVHRRIGALLAKVHQINPQWFPAQSNSAGKHWHSDFVHSGSRQNNTFFLARRGYSSLFRVWADCSAWGPEHSLAQRLVTTHNDLHMGNIIFSEVVDRFFLVDIDCIGVGQAISDLVVFTSRICDHQPELKRAFLTGYLEVMAEIKSEERASKRERMDFNWKEIGDNGPWGLETLLVDCELARLGTWYAGEHLSLPTPVYNLDDQDIIQRILFAQKFAVMVRESVSMKDHIKTKGLLGTLGSLLHGRFQAEGTLLIHEVRQVVLQSGQGPWYFANLSSLSSALMSRLVSKHVNWPGTLYGAGGHQHISRLIEHYSSDSLPNVVEEVSLSIEEFSDWEGEELQHVTPGLFMAQFLEEWYI